MAASELGSALARCGEKERASESEWEGVAGSRPSCLYTGSTGPAVAGVWPPHGGRGLAWSDTDVVHVHGHQSPACTSNRATL